MKEQGPTCSDCHEAEWCLPDQARHQLGGQDIESFICPLDKKMNKPKHTKDEKIARTFTEGNGPAKEQAGDDEVEVYQGAIEWHKYSDSRGRLYRFGLIELTDKAGRQFVWGSHSGYRLVVLFDGANIGQAYAFREGKGQDDDYLSPGYVQEKLERALYFQQDVLAFTQKLAGLLGRPTAKAEEKPGQGVCAGDRMPPATVVGPNKTYERT